MAQTEWTREMTIAWIAYKEANEIRYANDLRIAKKAFSAGWTACQEAVR